MLTGYYSSLLFTKVIVHCPFTVRKVTVPHRHKLPGHPCKTLFIQNIKDHILRDHTKEEKRKKITREKGKRLLK